MLLQTVHLQVSHGVLPSVRGCRLYTVQFMQALGQIRHHDPFFPQ